MPPVVRRVLAFPVAYAMITGDRRAAHGNGQHPRPVGMRKLAVEIRPSCDGTRRGQSSSGTGALPHQGTRGSEDQHVTGHAPRARAH